MAENTSVRLSPYTLHWLHPIGVGAPIKKFVVSYRMVLVSLFFCLCLSGSFVYFCLFGCFRLFSLFCVVVFVCFSLFVRICIFLYIFMYYYNITLPPPTQVENSSELTVPVEDWVRQEEAGTALSSKLIFYRYNSTYQVSVRAYNTFGYSEPHAPFYVHTFTGALLFFCPVWSSKKLFSSVFY